MEAEDLIIQYLNKTYQVWLASHHYVITEKEVNNTSNVFEIEAIADDVENTLGYESWQSMRACKKWYKSQVNILNKHFYEFIEPYKVTMTMVDWEVRDADGNELDIYKMFNELRKNYQVDEIIQKMYEDWKTKNIINYAKNIDDLFGNYDLLD